MTGRVGFARVSRIGFAVLSAILLALPLDSYPQSYLDAIRVEADKLDSGVSPEGGKAVTSEGADADDPRSKFEKELGDRYSGTYLFYQKLPKKSQEEVYLEYEGGASIDEVRKTIMNRFLHNR